MSVDDWPWDWANHPYEWIEYAGDRLIHRTGITAIKPGAPEQTRQGKGVSGSRTARSSARYPLGGSTLPAVVIVADGKGARLRYQSGRLSPKMARGVALAVARIYI